MSMPVEDVAASTNDDKEDIKFDLRVTTDFIVGRFKLSVSNYSQVPWEEDSPSIVIQRCVSYCKALNKISKTSKKAVVILKEHNIHSTICSIYFSNLIEEKGLNFTDTCALCCQVLIGDYVEDIHSGSSDKASRKEVVQHTKAFMFLKLELVENSKPLSESIIQEAHCILMEGMCREDGVDASPGVYRSTSCSAGNQEFTSPYLIPSSMERIIVRYNSERRSPEVDPFYLSTWLSYEFVMCHPFVDGNGRMSRLLLNMSLMTCGILFPISFGFSKHKRAKRHYIQCLRKASTHGGRPTRLAYLVLSSFQDSAASFFESIRISVPEEYPKELLIEG